MRAARTLFVEKGYHDTRPQDIARLAGVGHGTFYLHFADKRDCFMAFVDQAGEELDQEIFKETEGITDFREQIRAILVAILKYSHKNEGVLLSAMLDTEVIARDRDHARESIMERWGRQWAKRLFIHAKTGVVDSSYDFDIIGSSLGGLIREAALSAARHGRSQSEMIENLTEFIVRGLTPPSGRHEGRNDERHEGPTDASKNHGA